MVGEARTEICCPLRRAAAAGEPGGGRPTSGAQQHQRASTGAAADRRLAAALRQATSSSSSTGTRAGWLGGRGGRPLPTFLRARIVPADRCKAEGYGRNRSIQAARARGAIRQVEEGADAGGGRSSSAGLMYRRRRRVVEGSGAPQPAVPMPSETITYVLATTTTAKMSQPQPVVSHPLRNETTWSGASASVCAGAFSASGVGGEGDVPPGEGEAGAAARPEEGGTLTTMTSDEVM